MAVVLIGRHTRYIPDPLFREILLRVLAHPPKGDAVEDLAKDLLEVMEIHGREEELGEREG